MNLLIHFLITPSCPFPLMSFLYPLRGTSTDNVALPALMHMSFIPRWQQV